MAVQFLHLDHNAHNDIKPENTFLDGFGHVKLGDFGCAKDLSFAGDAEKQGTLLDDAPEMLRSGPPFDGNNRWPVARRIRSGRLKCHCKVDRAVLHMVRWLTKVNQTDKVQARVLSINSMILSDSSWVSSMTSRTSAFRSCCFTIEPLEWIQSDT
jgi:serine/threonine protein kinase